MAKQTNTESAPKTDKVDSETMGVYTLIKCERIQGKFSKEHSSVVRKKAFITHDYAKQYNRGFLTSGMFYKLAK